MIMAEENGHSVNNTFYECGTVAQWKYVLSQYHKVIQIKADSKTKGGKELLKLDTWYREQLPDLIKKRSIKHLLHEEIVKVMKWKLLRGKFRPRLTDLVKTNTPLAVTTATKRGFKKIPNLSQAIQALATLKGVGPAMASAVLAAGSPDNAAFMSDEAMLSIPDTTSIDYTTSEYLKFSNHIQKCVDRLNKSDASNSWTPHKVEQTLWTHYLARQLEPSILDDMPSADATDSTVNSQNNNNDETQETITTEAQNGDASCEEQNGGEKASSEECNGDDKKPSDELNGEVSKSMPDAQNGDESSSSDAAVKVEENGDESSSDAPAKVEENGDKSPDAGVKVEENEDEEASCDSIEAKEKEVGKKQTEDSEGKADDVEEPPSKKQKA